MYGLDAEVINKIKAVFENFPEISKAVLYGSRAKGNHRKGSDIDLTLYGKNLSVKTIYNVTEELDTLYLPYSFDISIYQQIDNPDLIDHIKRVGQVFYERNGSRQKTGKDAINRVSTDVKQLPEGWEWKKLGEVCDVIPGQSPKSKFYNKNENGLPFYQGKKEFTEKFINSPITWTTNITKEAQKDDILMSVRAPVGPVNFSTQNICIGRGLSAIRAGNTVDKYFLYYFLVKHKNEITGNKGAVFDSINRNQIKAIQIPLPPLAEQKRIVAILDEGFAAIDKAKANAEKNIANARELFESYLNGIFANPGEDWEEKKLGDVCDSFEYGTSLKSKKAGEIPVLRMGNIQNGEIDWTKLVFTDDQDEISKYLLHKNDVLFNRTNSPELVGKTAIYRNKKPAIFAGYLIRINYDKNILNPHFLNIWLNWKKTREHGISIMISSVNQANISASKLKQYPIIVPPLSEQKRIVNQLDKLSAKSIQLESIYQQKITALDELKKSILKKAFDGDL